MLSVKQDIRITKTNIALSGALLELLKKKDFSKITVNDICRFAMVSRSTFYLHFRDKYQLTLYCLQLEKRKLEETVKDREPYDIISAVLTAIYGRKELFRQLVRAEMDFELFRMTRTFFYNSFYDVLKTLPLNETETADSSAPLCMFYANGLADTIMWWIGRNFFLPVEIMARDQYNLLSKILPGQALSKYP